MGGVGVCGGADLTYRGINSEGLCSLEAHLLSKRVAQRRREPAAASEVRLERRQCAQKRNISV